MGIRIHRSNVSITPDGTEGGYKPNEETETVRLSQSLNVYIRENRLL